MIEIGNIAGTKRAVACRKAIVKLGSAVVIGEDGKIDRTVIQSLGAALATLRAKQVETIVVTSGAVGMGRNRLKSARPKTLPEKQALAAVGQISLMHVYEGVLAERGLTAAQILLTRGDMEDRKRYLNARATLERLLAVGAVPIVNENDTTATEEISFGDNDMLSAYVAVKMKADLLILLSSVEGLHATTPSGKRSKKIVRAIESFDEKILAMAGSDQSAWGIGGMRSKLAAARFASEGGVHTVIAGGKRAGIVEEIFGGDFRGTYIAPTGDAKKSARDRWIGFGRPSKGRKLILDDGAVEAIARGKRSLLPVGVVGVEGDFERGDVVDLCARDGRAIARGLVNYNAADVKKIMGRKTTDIEGILGERRYDEIVHRDDLVGL